MGAILVLLGLIAAVLDIFIPESSATRRATLLHVAVILVALGVLLGADFGALTD